METLNEVSVFEAVSSTQNDFKLCSDKCRKSFKNGPNYQQQVSVCTSRCKIQQLTLAMRQLQVSIKPGVPTNNVLQTKLMYLKNRRDNEIMKLTSYNNKLKKRQTTIPVSMSLKPSKEILHPQKGA